MKIKQKKLRARRVRGNVPACQRCTAGSCCYEGAELTAAELKKIIAYNPPVAQPWFRLVKDSEDPNARYPFTTLVRNGTCVFQNMMNRCVIYEVRPTMCCHFPLEHGKAAPYFKRLCALFYHQWPNNAVKRTYRQREKK